MYKNDTGYNWITIPSCKWLCTTFSLFNIRLFSFVRDAKSNVFSQNALMTNDPIIKKYDYILTYVRK